MQTCNFCKIEFPECWCHAVGSNNAVICEECVKRLFFEAFDVFSIPLMEETKGRLRYTMKARGMRRVLPRELREKVFRRDKYTCKSCGTKNRKYLTVDHIKPYKLDGPDVMGNFQTLCRSCNSRKSAKYET